MAYSGPDDASLPSSVKGLSDADRSKWVNAWNKAFQDCDGDDCEAEATRTANEAIKAHEHMPLLEFRTQEAPEWIPLLPEPGSYYHQLWGDLDLTEERIARIVKSFEDRIYQKHLPIDAEHELDLSGALGWIQELRTNSDGSVDAKVEWTDRGAGMIENDRFRYVSPSYYPEWQDARTEVVHTDVLTGAALTTRPFFKDAAMRSIVARDDGMYLFERSSDTGIVSQYRMTERIPDVKFNEMSVEQIAKLTPVQLQEALKGVKLAELTAEQSQAVASILLDGVDEVSELTKERDELKAQLDEIEASEDVEDEDEEDEDADETGDDEEDEDDDAVELNERMGTLSAEVKRLRRDHAEANKTIAAMRIKEQRRDYTEISAEWHGETDQHVDHLVSLSEKFGQDSKEFKHYVALNEELATVRAEALGVLGSERPDDLEGSAWGRIEAKARKLTEAGGDLTHEQAIAKIMEQNPDLYEEYVNEGV